MSSSFADATPLSKQSGTGSSRSGRAWRPRNTGRRPPPEGVGAAELTISGWRQGGVVMGRRRRRKTQGSAAAWKGGRRRRGPTGRDPQTRPGAGYPRGSRCSTKMWVLKSPETLSFGQGIVVAYCTCDSRTVVGTYVSCLFKDGVVTVSPSDYRGVIPGPSL